MNRTFGGLADGLTKLTAELPEQPPRTELVEIVASTRLLALRAEFVSRLYEACAPNTTAAGRSAALLGARALLGTATALVRQQEARYRVPVARSGGWRPNPTSYVFGYIWTVSSLYYWWRDLGRAERGSKEATHSPCYLNLQVWHRSTANLVLCTSARSADPLAWGSIHL